MRGLGWCSALGRRVLANDFDPDGDILTIIDVETPTEGKIAISADQQSLVFTPTDLFLSSLLLDYTISDGKGGTATAEVEIYGFGISIVDPSNR